MNSQLRVRHLGMSSYQDVWQQMKEFTHSRNNDTCDEAWVVEHPPVFTLGQAGKSEHILAAGDIPIVKSDRGGQVTYHGPGQLIVYLLIDIRRLGINVRQLVSGIEVSIVNLLNTYNVVAAARKDAPGVYVDGKKIAALGLRIRKGCSYHGLSLNVDMDMEPYSQINPCGYAEMEIIQLRDLGVTQSLMQVSELLLTHIQGQFSYTSLIQD
ncbi:MAG: lipoyl(octanoyl) transferase LipB [Pseudomonadales bacterium]|nr:lipoyl(octanoyl) transferase LipB [Pseudomonadales bacterium]